MKKVICQCGRTIEVRGGVAGFRMPFPKEIYLCECGYAYIPIELGCWGVGFESHVEPLILTPSEYVQYKEYQHKEYKEEVSRYTTSIYTISPDEAIVEISAKVIT